MFNKIRYRLLISYFLAFASLLGIFALAVRNVFARTLHQQLTERLTALAEGAAVSVDFEKQHYKINDDFYFRNALIIRHQALQWFDPQGRLIAQKGEAILNLPISKSKFLQLQSDRTHLQAVTLPIISNRENRIIGYVRASQTLEEIDRTLSKLDWGLGGGIVMALALSSIGGLFLTRQAMQPIEESFQRLKQFTADASHELRSPLMAIKSNTSVALKYAEGMRSSDAEKFQAIASATNQIIRLTEDLLFLARTDRFPNQDWDSVNLMPILNNLLQLYKSQAIAKQIDLKAEITENIYLLGDTVQLTRLFTNLLENALHYTQQGGSIEIKTSHIGGNLYISVRDTGVGIAPEDIEQVFERFWRADRSRSYWEGGSGLGLAIACAIAQNHGGLITVKSQLKIGSCFTVRLPANTSPIQRESSFI